MKSSGQWGRHGSVRMHTSDLCGPCRFSSLKWEEWMCLPNLPIWITWELFFFFKSFHLFMMEKENNESWVLISSLNNDPLVCLIWLRLPLNPFLFLPTFLQSFSRTHIPGTTLQGTLIDQVYSGIWEFFCFVFPEDSVWKPMTWRACEISL